MSRPLVSIICLCYNHGRFVTEALESLCAQTYPEIEIIVVDDASEDDSKQIISDFISGHPAIRFVNLMKNIGNCAAFNQGWALSKGTFIIDFAADDVLLPNRVENGVNTFLSEKQNVGVLFSNAELIDEYGAHKGLHSDRFPSESIPQGNIYKDLIEKYFICSPTMMIRREVLDTLQGYDETLAYEDFDFWIRSSRLFEYAYVPEVLVKRRLVKGSMSDKQFRWGNKQQQSTYEVCKKIMDLNRTEDERMALTRRLRYEFLHCLKRVDLYLAVKYFFLWRQNNSRRYS